MQAMEIVIHKNRTGAHIDCSYHRQHGDEILRDTNRQQVALGKNDAPIYGPSSDFTLIAYSTSGGTVQGCSLPE